MKNTTMATIDRHVLFERPVHHDGCVRGEEDDKENEVQVQEEQEEEKRGNF